MKKIGFLIFGAAILIGIVFANFVSFGRVELPRFVSVSWGEGVKGSGNIVVENRNVTGFSAIEAGGVFHVEAVSQKEFSVQVEADDNLLPLIKTEVRDGVLVLSTEKSIKSRSRIVVRIAGPDINAVDLSGAARMELKDVKSASVKLETSGASKLTVTGETGGLSAELSGASRVDASGLRTENAEIDASGASNASVSVTGKLRADASGASKINYTGNPQSVERNTTGAAKVSQD